MIFCTQFYRKEGDYLDYVITNHTKKLFIRLNQNGAPETCGKQLAQHFENSKARNIIDNLPKKMKKFNFYVEPIPDIEQKVSDESSDIKEKTINNDDYIPSENINRWIDKFGACGDILDEAEQRENELIIALDNSDKELLDLLHIIEMEKPKDMFNGWKLYKQIKENRTKRREIKDEILIIENVLENIKDVSCMHREQVQKAIDGLFGRKYKFRIIEEGDENADL